MTTRIRDQDLILRCSGNDLVRTGDVAGHRHRGLAEFERPDVATCATWVDITGQRAHLAPANRLRAHWVLVDGIYRPSILLEGKRTNRIENSDVEADTAGHNANNSTRTRDSEQAFRGGWSLKVVTQNAGSSGNYWVKRDGTRMAATAAKLHTISHWVYAPAASVGKTFNLRIEWYDAAVGGAQISSSSSASIALAAGWNRYHFTALAPAGTVACVPTFYTNAAQGIFDYWSDLAQLEEAPHPSLTAISTGTAAAERLSDGLVIPVNVDMNIDWTVFLWLYAPHTAVASWADADSAELDPFAFGLSPVLAGTNQNDSIRLHRQNAASTWEWEYGANTPTASRTFTPSANAQKLCLRHRASDHVLSAAVDGGAFASSGVNANALRNPVALRLGHDTAFSPQSQSGHMALLDFQLARGLWEPADMIEPVP